MGPVRLLISPIRRSREGAYMEQEEYRGNVVHFVVEKRSDSPYRNATGYLVFYQARKLRSLRIEGTPNHFTLEEDAKQEFLSIGRS